MDGNRIMSDKRINREQLEFVLAKSFRGDRILAYIEDLEKQVQTLTEQVTRCIQKENEQFESIKKLEEENEELKTLLNQTKDKYDFVRREALNLRKDYTVLDKALELSLYHIPHVVTKEGLITFAKNMLEAENENEN